MRRSDKLVLRAPVLCASECNGLIRTGPAMLISGNRLLHEGCVKYACLAEPGTLVWVVCKYRIPRDEKELNLCVLRRMPSIDFFERIAKDLPPAEAVRMYAALSTYYLFRVIQGKFHVPAATNRLLCSVFSRLGEEREAAAWDAVDLMVAEKGMASADLILLAREYRQMQQ